MVLIFRRRHFATRLCSSHPEVYHRASSVDFFSFPALLLRFPMLLTQTVGQTGSILLFLPFGHGLLETVLGRPRPFPPTFSMKPPGTLLFLVLGRFVLSLCSILALPHTGASHRSVPVFRPIPNSEVSGQGAADKLLPLRPSPPLPQAATPQLDSKLKPRPEGQAPPPPLAGPAPHSPEASPRARRLLGAGGEGRCRVGRGVASPPLWPRWPSAGGMGSLRRRQPGRSRDPGAQGWRLHLHQGLHLRRDRPPHSAPLITAIPPPPE